MQHNEKRARRAATVNARSTIGGGCFVPRKPTHGGRMLARKLFDTRPSSPISDRTRRALRRIEHGLTAQPIEHLHALTVGRLTRLELILQAYEAWCLTHADAEPPKHMLGVANAWRRTGEFLALLEQQLADGRADATHICSRCNRAYSAGEYLSHPCQTTDAVTATTSSPQPVAASPTGCPPAPPIEDEP